MSPLPLGAGLHAQHVTAAAGIEEPCNSSRRHARGTIGRMQKNADRMGTN
jgi:hypothetical protein